MVCWGNLAVAQGTDLPTTRDIDSRLKEQLRRNDEQLRKLLSDSTSRGSLDSLPMDEPLSRGLDEVPTPTILRVDFLLRADQTYRVSDSNGMPGFLLTGKWINDYAQKIRLVPALEQTLSGYRKQAELNNQLIGEMETALGIKDQKIAVLEEINDALRERGDLYKTKSEILSDPWYTKLFRSLSYPLGFTAGVFVGVIIANNAN